ncbi:MAG TPA: FlgD immunoglobulin-like domain containing protein, partial [Candidatus Cloacimonadota bacterium]|nr:FlgD immunoglobulin-like domain containing protein [Candidatus Cloacimonadota bacterium]
AGADPFTAKLGNSKHEIVDSLLAVDELSGSIYYQQNYITVDANWQEGETYIGDYYSWAWMTRFASIGYLSFELPQIPDGYHLQSAHLMMYIGAMKGNSTSGVYPIFDYGNTSIYPEGILEHIDYGEAFNSIDVIPSTVYSTYTFFDLESLSPPCWVSYDVTDCLLLDSAENRSLTQYRIYLNGFSDWDNREDYIATSTGSSTYYQNSAKISYALSDGVSNIDPSIPQPQLTISCYPNPFSDKSSIKVKAHEPGLYKLNIYNIKGQLIRSYGNSSKPSGDHIFHWDGRDDTGRQVSGGIYFAVVEAGRHKASSKILYVR